ncbi:MAG: tripartite tricarboxylate transporter substrate binding protein [Thermodesulfobacteriota bacterium]
MNRKAFFICGLVLALGLFLLGSAAYAAGYPEKDITIMVGYSPGGSTDTTVRTVATMASKLLGKPVVVVNRPGAGGSLALAALVKAKPDGYTLGSFNISAPMGNAVRATDPFNASTDFTPICNFTSFPNAIVVPAKSKFKTLADLLKAAKAKPGVITGATSGVGSSQHFALELLKHQAGVNITHVPFKGSAPAVTALLGGHVDCGDINSVDVIQHIKAGKLRALAVTSAKRIPELPEVPSIVEAGFPGAVIVSWIGCAGPKGMPPAVVQKLATTFQKILADPAIKSKLKSIGFNTTYMPPDQFRQFVKNEYDRYMELAQKAGIRKKK